MPLAYLHYDVFTSDPFAGNQLAVFTDARGLDGPRMQRLACEMNFSESTFILPSERPGTDIRMRIFTPHVEMPMAGHPTIGSTFALAHAGVIRPGTTRFVFGLNVGPTPVDLEWQNGALAFAWMTQLPPKFSPPLEARAQAAAALGLQLTDLVPDLPVQEITCGVSYLMVPLRDRTTVDRAVADLTALKTLLTGDSAVFLFSVDSGSSGQSVYSRMFAPGLGVTEDPATGSASGPLGCYLVHHRIVSGDAARSIVSQQGVAMGRPSRIHIAIGGGPEAINDVKVGGQAVLVGRGEIVV
ncbi:MAG TPA: PhzF family phenazine biosynthesis protein [Vicinamibacterales bacterium]|nr:PhzF family phenazine biosynthesis protein [Vicinamibacterales bacterium]